MNKKFSTLVAGALLVTAFSANAQTSLTVKPITTKIETGTPTRYYVLNTGSAVASETNNFTQSVLSVDKDGAVESKSVAFGTINDQLWTIKVSAVAGSNRFVLTNAATGATLSFAPQYAVAADATGKVVAPAAGSSAYQLTGADTEWSWVSAPNALGAELQSVKALTSAFRTDSTMALAVTGGKVFAYKYANNKPAIMPSAVSQISAQALIPGSKTMTANELNVLGTTPNKYFTLNSGNTGLIGDIFTGNKFHAETAATAGTVKLNLIGADAAVSKKYAYVDTAFHIATGLNKDKLYKLAINKKAEETTGLAPEAMEFEIARNLFTDKLIVSVNAEALKQKGPADSEGSSWQGDQADAAIRKYLTVSAIQLTADTKVFTLFEDGSTNLVFNVNTVASDDTRTSVADGVYFVKNSKGQYMTSLIHQNGKAADWATVKATEQNVNHMPAFQWVILKENTYSDKAKAISPMKVVNREFATATLPTYQLHKKAGATYYYTAGSTDSLELVPVAAEFLKDSLLGYKNLTEKDLLVESYTFNYLHPYATTKYIAKSASAKDSILNVLDDKGFFSLKAGENKAYGYKVADANGRIPGLKQLYRTNYKMFVGKKFVSVAKENKFALGAFKVAAIDSFYFKENNQFGEKCYHAMVVANKTGLDVLKAGVADDDQAAVLKEQVIGETRTSSFNIEKVDAPLYRRFNNAELEGNDNDGADTLRFVEQYRGELLQLEANPSFAVKGADFLGLYTADQSKSGLSFFVDTAWLNRGYGSVKPQYLISIDREDIKGTPFERCAECKRLIAAGKPAIEGCKHDVQGTPDMRIGKYLVNFTDSVKNGAMINSKDGYNWKQYSRAGFVKAIHYGDSLYILKDQFAGVKNADVNLDLLKKMITANDKAGDKKGSYVKSLCGDNHKYYTWSMRYIKPGTDNQKFLMESMSTEKDDIAPIHASWLKSQNGCLVMSDPKSSEFDTVTDGDDALIFDVKYISGDKVATDNAVVTPSAVSVIASEGQVTIANAAAKKVVISNILGQVVANTILSSDNATIAVPAGIVVVAVEGEAAVKAIVK